MGRHRKDGRVVVDNPQEALAFTAYHQAQETYGSDNPLTEELFIEWWAVNGLPPVKIPSQDARVLDDFITHGIRVPSVELT